MELTPLEREIVRHKMVSLVALMQAYVKVLGDMATPVPVSAIEDLAYSAVDLCEYVINLELP